MEGHAAQESATSVQKATTSMSWQQNLISSAIAVLVSTYVSQFVKFMNEHQYAVGRPSYRGSLRVEIALGAVVMGVVHGFDQWGPSWSDQVIKIIYMSYIPYEGAGMPAYMFFVLRSVSPHWLFPPAAGTSLKMDVCAYMAALGLSPVDALREADDPVFNGSLQDAWRELGVWTSLLVAWYLCRNDDLPSSFWLMILEPFAFWITNLSMYNLIVSLFSSNAVQRNQDIVPRSFWYRAKAIFYTLPLVFFSHVYTSFLTAEDNWFDMRYQSQTYEHIPDFVYEQPISDSEVRIIRLCKRTLFKLPECRLEKMSIPYAYGYTACSYVWGDPMRCKLILMDGKKLLVTDSAYQVIRRKQSFFSESRLWIDAICINQSDDQEKTGQVGIMRTIYRSADYVDAYIWSPYVFSPVVSFLKILRDTRGTQRSRILLPGWAYFVWLLNQPWFLRVWIQQEAVVARKLRLVCGTDVFDWELLAGVIDQVRHDPDLSNKLLREMEHLTELSRDKAENIVLKPLWMDRVRRKILLEGKADLENLLHISAGSQATLTVDRIYALLGMADSEAAQKIGINYKASPADVFTRTMVYLIEVAEELSVLAHAGLCMQENGLELPSWVSPWTLSRDWVLNPSSSFGWSAATNMTHTARRFQSYLVVVSRKVGDLTKLGEAYPNVNSALLSFGPKPEELEELRRLTVFLHSFWHSAIARYKHHGIEDQTRAKFMEALTFGSSSETINADHYDDYAWAMDIANGGPDVQINKLWDKPLDDESELHDRLTRAMSFFDHVNGGWNGKRYAVVEPCLLAAVPDCTLPTDEIHLLASAGTPFVFRPVRRYQHPTANGTFETTIESYQLVGPCYVQGIMYGEMLPGANGRNEQQEMKQWKVCALT